MAKNFFIYIPTPFLQPTPFHSKGRVYDYSAYRKGNPVISPFGEGKQGYYFGEVR